MKCLVCSRAVMKKGKKRYHDACWAIDQERRKEDQIVETVESTLIGSGGGPAFFGRSKHSKGGGW